MAKATPITNLDLSWWHDRKQREMCQSAGFTFGNNPVAVPTTFKFLTPQQVSVFPLIEYDLN